MSADLIFRSGMDDSEYNRTFSLMVKTAEKRTKEINDKMGAIGHGGGGRGANWNDAQWALRDFAEGRTAFGMVRLTEAIGLTGVAIAGVVGGLTVAGIAFEHYSEGVAKAREENEALSASFSKLTKEVAVGGFAPTKEDKTIEALKELIKREEEYQALLLKRRSGGSGLINAAGDFLTGKTITGEAFEDISQLKESRARQGVIIGEIEQVERQKARNRSFEEDAKDAATHKAALQKQIEEGNAIYMHGENEKRDMQKKAAEDERNLDAANARQRMGDLKKQVEDGNALYQKDLDHKKDLRQKVKDLAMEGRKDRLAELQATADKSAAEATVKQQALSEFGRMSSDDRRGMIRRLQKEDRELYREAEMDKPGVHDARHGASRLRTERDAAAKKAREDADKAQQKKVFIDALSIKQLTDEINKLIVAP